MYTFIFDTLNQFEAFINSNRSTRAPYPLVDKGNDVNAISQAKKGSNEFLGKLPGASILIGVVPQAGDAVHSFLNSRMLPIKTPTANSGGWAGPNYAYDPPPDIPPIVLPPAIWNAIVGTYNLTGLSAVVEPGRTPLPTPGYPGVFQPLSIGIK